MVFLSNHVFFLFTICKSHKVMIWQSITSQLLFSNETGTECLKKQSAIFQMKTKYLILSFCMMIYIMLVT